jgi:SAM-dependent methyltransferase
MQSAQFQLHAQIEEKHWWFVARRRILKDIVREVLPPDRNAIVIDVGCGTGANIAALARDYRCVGIDTSAEAVELATARFASVQFLCGLAPGDLGSLAQQARLFLLTDVLEHVRDDAGLLGELVAAASPGAYFLITVPADMALWSQHDVAFGHYRRYTLPELADLWARLNVTTRLLTYYNTRLYRLVKVIRTFNRLRHRTGGAAGTDFSSPARPVNFILERVFVGERRRLLRLLRGDSRRRFRRGVSLIALLEKSGGLGTGDQGPGINGLNCALIPSP